MSDPVLLTHPKIPGSAFVAQTPEAAEAWATEGWKPADSALSRDALAAMATERGLDVDAKASKTQLAAALAPPATPPDPTASTPPEES